MGEFKFKDTVENLKTNLLDNLGLLGADCDSSKWHY